MIDFTLISETIFIDIDYNDSPKFSTASIESCLYNGKEATKQELVQINANYDFINNRLHEHIMNGEHYETIKAIDRLTLDVEALLKYTNNK